MWLLTSRWSNPMKHLIPYLQDDQKAADYLRQLRWPNGRHVATLRKRCGRAARTVRQRTAAFHLWALRGGPSTHAGLGATPRQGRRGRTRRASLSGSTRECTHRDDQTSHRRQSERRISVLHG